MMKIKHNYREYRDYGAEKWLELLWHLYYQKLAIVNLLGDREQERSLLRSVEVLGNLPFIKDGTIELLMLEVRLFSDIGDLNLAEERIDKLFQSLNEDTSRETLRQAFEWRALVAREKTLTKEALDYYNQAEQYANNELSRAGIWLDKGLALVYDHQLNEAERMLNQAIEIYRRYNSTDMLGDACNNLGICLINQERVDDALKAYLEASRCYDRTGYKLGNAIVSGNISQIYWCRGDYDSAFRLANKCRQLGTEAEDQISIALSYEMEGRMLLDLGSYNRSFDCLSRAIKTVEEVGDRTVEILDRLYLAQCCSRMGDCRQATVLMGECLKACRELQDPEINRRLMMGQIDVWSRCQSPELVLGKIDSMLNANRDNLRQHDLTLLLYIKSHLLLQVGEDDAAWDSFYQLTERLSGTEYQSFIAGIHALGAALFGVRQDRPDMGGHRQKGREIVSRICQSISDTDLRRAFLSRPEFKTLGLTSDLYI